MRIRCLFAGCDNDAVCMCDDCMDCVCFTHVVKIQRGDDRLEKCRACSWEDQLAENVVTR